MKMSQVSSHKSQARRVENTRLFLALLSFLLVSCDVVTLCPCFAQQAEEIEFVLDANANTIPLPKNFRPSIDLSGRGFHTQHNWPQGVAASEVIDTWQKDIGFGGVYRLQYNLWEVQELSKYQETQGALLRNYEGIIKKISDAGGIVILDIFGTPAGLGKVLDKKSPPFDPRAYKELVKSLIRNLSCEKRYNIWYELWTAPDSEDFFLGRRQEYLSLYRMVAEAVKELEVETKIQIPLGGPGTSWWFQNIDGNTVATPERSLMYELIKFCYHYRLPLDFISWHSYSSDVRADQDATIYRKSAVGLIRDWLTYFHFDYNIPCVVSEWNYDSSSNIDAARQEKSHITASYIPARLRHMYEAGIDYGVYYCLEDFHNNIDGVARNVGVFGFDSSSETYKGAAKSTYSVFRMLSLLDNRLYPVSLKVNDDFVTVIATKGTDTITILVSNYIDPQMANNFISRSIGTLSEGERKILLTLIKTKKFDLLLQHKLNLTAVSLTRRLRALLKKALEMNDRATRLAQAPRTLKLTIKNVKDAYSFEKFVIDAGCSLNCEFKPVEEKEVDASQDAYQETLTLKPYSVQYIVLKKKPKEVEKVAPASAEPPASGGGQEAEKQTNETAAIPVPQTVAANVTEGIKPKE